MPRPDQAPWPNARYLRGHFHKHGPKLGKWDVQDYDGSARGTIRAGTRFTFQSRDTGEGRVGYFDERHDRLTAPNEDETVIITHMACTEAYCRRQLKSDYVRRRS